MKKTSYFVTFFVGIFVGAVPCFFTFNWHVSPTAVETSLAEMLYEDLQPYANDYRLDMVLQLLQDQVAKKRPPIGNDEMYSPLIDLAMQCSEKEGAEALENAEKFLEMLSKQDNVLPIIKNRIYVEILEAGSGAVITPQDSISIHFKEYSLDGTLLKDTTSARAFIIPLNQTIKGFQLGIQGAKIGERRKLYLHPEFGFDKLGRKDLLIYEVFVISKE